MAIGLGNPGSAYQATRHNVGFGTIDKLAELLNINLKKPVFKRYLSGCKEHEGKVLYLVKPLTFMNRSGEIIKDILKRTKNTIADLIVICDTLDLPPGECRLKRKGSAAGHRGLSSITEQLGTDEFSRFFIGVGRPQQKDEVIDYVLSAPSVKEYELISMAVEQTCKGVLRLLHEPIDKVMNDFNKKNR